MVRGKNWRSRPGNIGWLNHRINSWNERAPWRNKSRDETRSSCRNYFWREIEIILIKQIRKIQLVLIVDVVEIIVVVVIVEVKKSGLQTSTTTSSG